MKTLLILTLAVTAAAQPWTNIVASSRIIDFSNAGVAGGIPTNRTQCGSTK